MNLDGHSSTRHRPTLIVAMLLAIAWPLRAQTTPAAISSAPSAPASNPLSPLKTAQAAAPGDIEIDRVVAVVNGQLILESDIDEERRLAAFQPYANPAGGFSRADAIDRVIDRTLILQQAGDQVQPPITDADVDADLVELRKAIFACRPHQCETEIGWQQFLVGHGFTEQEFRQRWRDRMETLRFIEQRFRMGIRIEPAEIKEYYTKTLLPEYEARNVTPPKLEGIQDRIQEILLQQRVGKLLDDWLKALRASGNVRMVKPGEVAP